MEKIRITVQVGTPEKCGRYGVVKSRIYDTNSLHVESSLDRIISTVEDYKKKFSCDYEDLHFRADQDCGCRYECNCTPRYILYGTRLETDFEAELRIAEKQRLSDLQLARDKAAYEKLKEKFG